MPNNVIDVSSLSSEIGSILSMYSNNVTEATEKWLKETAEQTAKNVKANAKSAGFKGAKEYISGWKTKKVNGHWVVYNAKKPGLAHLLEHGHEIVVHGVSTGKRSKAYPHIKKAEEQINELIKELEKNLEGIQ